MADQERLPISNPRRIQNRQRKLWCREMTNAIRDDMVTAMLEERNGATEEMMQRRQARLRILCPCNLCNKGYRCTQLIATVAKHLSDRMFGRHPRCYGSTQNVDADDSDMEWD